MPRRREPDACCPEEAVRHAMAASSGVAFRSYRLYEAHDGCKLFTCWDADGLRLMFGAPPLSRRLGCSKHWSECVTRLRPPTGTGTGPQAGQVGHHSRLLMALLCLVFRVG